IVRGHVAQHGSANVNHPLLHQAANLAPFQTHFIEALDVGSNGAVRLFLQGFRPEGSFVVLVLRQVAPGAHDLQIGLGVFLSLGKPGGGREGGSEYQCFERFHGIASGLLQNEASWLFRMSVMSMAPGACVMQNGGLLSLSTSWGVTPQAQNTGTWPGGISTTSPWSGWFMSRMP